MSANLQQIYKHNQDIDLLSQTIDCYNALHLREDNFKLDLDSAEGQQAFKDYADKIEKLIEMTSAHIQKRQFRDNYTKAYRVLYSEHELGYIPQVFDSAQEAYPCIWVNGDRYDFTQSTIQKGQQLVDAYFRLIQLIRFVYLHSQNKYAQIPSAYKIQLKQRLEEFDSFWIQYEKIYISELIVIEEKSKEIIIQTININEELTNYENQQKIKGKIFMMGEEYHSLRKQLCEKIAKINSVANMNGKGRDDLQYDILLSAEGLLTTITDSQSKSVRQVAEKIRETFGQLRQVLKLFSQNIQLIDPQLKNNPDLVNALVDYECFWEKGKRYFLEEKKSSQILAFSTILDAAKQKYESFRDLLEFSDPNVFWIMPCLVVLSSLEGQDEGLAKSFLQESGSSQMKLQKQYGQLQELYRNWKQRHTHIKPRQLYNELQHQLIDTSEQVRNNEDITTKIKEFAVSLERINPTDWNDMLSVLLIQEC